jgi:hypothetical protein
MFLTSFAFFIPAKYASSAGRPWHAAMFAAMAMICVAYHVCDAKASNSLMSTVQCGKPLSHMLTLADHGCAYFCFAQMAFLVLGPEDHNLQWPHQDTAPRKPWARVPTNVVLFSRVLLLLGIGSFLVLYPVWNLFHYQMALICVGLVILGSGQFWLSHPQREHAPKVLFHAVFWRRLGSLGLLPLCLCLALFLAMENIKFGAGVAHAAWHLLVAALATNVMRTVYHSLPDPLHTALSYVLRDDELLADIHSTSSKNPAVAHYLLGIAAVTTCLTLLVAHTVEVYMEFSVAIVALTALVAMAVALLLISTVQTDAVGELKPLSNWRQLGFFLGHVSIF